MPLLRTTPVNAGYRREERALEARLHDLALGFSGRWPFLVNGFNGGPGNGGGRHGLARCAGTGGITTGGHRGELMGLRARAWAWGCWLTGPVPADGTPSRGWPGLNGALRRVAVVASGCPYSVALSARPIDLGDVRNGRRACSTTKPPCPPRGSWINRYAFHQHPRPSGPVPPSNQFPSMLARSAPASPRAPRQPVPAPAVARPAVESVTHKPASVRGRLSVACTRRPDWPARAARRLPAPA